MKSINPYNNQLLAEYTEFSESQIADTLSMAHTSFKAWRRVPLSERAAFMVRLAQQLRGNSQELALLITSEMGKRISEAKAEIEKCAWVCEHYAEHAADMLQDETIKTEAHKSYARFESIGVILAVMPWNYPFWQLFRCAVPAMMSGNTMVLKHASNVQGCALAMEQLFHQAGFPNGAFRTLVIGSGKVEQVIANPKVRGVALTGSEYAGSQVAMLAGKHLKKSILELGGSDPCIVLADANVPEAAKMGVMSRMLTSGQTCISAKRFIVLDLVYDSFVHAVAKEMSTYVAGDPSNDNTTLAPLSDRRFAEELHQQVMDSVALGAKCIMGGELPKEGAFYPPTILIDITSDMPVFAQETFGPVIAIYKVTNEMQAIDTANDSDFGLGAAIWSEDLVNAEKLAHQLEAGAVYVNDLVKSDPRLPFGGVKNSGYGRELSAYGLKEFCNIKSICVK